MKKISMFFLFVSIGVCSNAQEVKQERSTVNAQATEAPVVKKVKVTESTGSKPITISKTGNNPQITHDEAYYQNEISKINSQIDDINTKISIVNSNPVEKSNATDSGWFDQMDNIKSELEVRKSELQSHLN